MTIEDTAVVTMTGKELKDLLEQIDKTREAFEDAYVTKKKVDEAYRQRDIANTNYDAMLNKVMELQNYKISYQVLKEINTDMKLEINTLRDSCFKSSNNSPAIYK